MARGALTQQVVKASVGRRAPDGEWIVGEALDAALARGEDLEIVHPLREGDCQNWDALCALWHHVVVALLHVKPASNESFALLALPNPISRDAYEHAAQIFFERLNVPALCISETPLLATYAAGVLSALVVNIGIEDSSAIAVSDCAVVNASAVVTKIGIVHCTWWLAYLLGQDARVKEALASVPGDMHANLYALAEQVVAEGHVRVDAPQDGSEVAASDADEAGSFDVAAALVEGRERDVVAQHAQHKTHADAAAERAHGDVVMVSFRGASVPVGSARTRFHDPLLQPRLLTRVPNADAAPPAVKAALESIQSGKEPVCVSLPAAVAQSVNNVPQMERRVQLWESLVVTGPIARWHGLVSEIVRACSIYMTNEPTESAQVVGEPNPLQPHAVRSLKVPDYFPEFKDRADLIPFLGATIFAKLVFGDLSGRNYITKTQYNESGPSIAFTIGSSA